ncbi:MAG: ABC transporter ATP-binding protein [Planctomycetota bacterium]
MPDFAATDIVKEFETPAGGLRILDGVSLELNKGDNVAVLGESGSGKSTFLHIAGTLDTPNSGTVSLLGENPASFGEKQLAAFRNKRIGFIFQQHHLLPQLSALENVLVPAIATGKPSAEMVARAEGLLKQVGLADRMTHRPGVLSGGECQRVAVARALIGQPDLILADEPTGSLDAANAAAIGELLLGMPQQSDSVLICVTHSEKLASGFAKQVRLENGKFV